MTSSVIADINKEYFGQDERKNYLKNDFSNVLHDIIQRDILCQILSECHKTRHHEKKEIDNNGNEVVYIGDFDPDNASFLASIFNTYEKGFMINVRQLLVTNEAGAGGKFIKDIAKLTTDDFVKYYKISIEGKILIPRLLIDEYTNTKINESNKGFELANFIDCNRSKIESRSNMLIAKASRLRDGDYLGQIIKPYQALKFHKDRRPEKYDIQEDTDRFGSITFNKRIRRDKSKIEINKIVEYLNEFADIVSLYQNLMNIKISFFEPNQTLETYVERTFALFTKETSRSTQKQTVKNIAKYLHKSLDLVGWRYDDI